MKAIVIVGCVTVLIILFVMLKHGKECSSNVNHSIPRSMRTRKIIEESPIKEVKTLRFDGLPDGEIYHTENGLASAEACAAGCLDDKACDSWAYYSLDGMCERRRNTDASGSMSYWKVKQGMLKVPGRELSKEMMKEQIADGADQCANLCALDPMCSKATYTSKSKCYTGTTLSGPDIVAGIIPARRSAVDLARNE